MTEQLIAYASLETRNHTFQAIGFSYEEVCLKLQTTFEKHMLKVEGSLTWEDVIEDVYVKISKGADGWVS
jgi:hypothetical protein